MNEKRERDDDCERVCDIQTDAVNHRLRSHTTLTMPPSRNYIVTESLFQDVTVREQGFARQILLVTITT